MTQDLKTPTLATIFSEVLQDLAFMFTDEEDPDLASDGTWLQTRIRYDGPASGALRLDCPRAFTVLLAANLLGTGPDAVDADSQASDAVKEFMNIVCGQLVTTRHGTQDLFDLTIPTIRELPKPPDVFPTPDDEVSTLYVEGHRLVLTYTPGP